MPFKVFALTDDTSVTIYKRKTSRSLRLRISPTGGVEVSIPTWVPYSAGLTFARSRKSWIEAQKQPQLILKDGQAIGKAHHLHFLVSSTIKVPAGRLKALEAVVNYPSHLLLNDQSVQAAARAVCIRALRTQAESLLPKRLKTLAELHNFSYKSVAIKQLKSRWGSCDTQQNIILNLFLMQLPWDCIDYVLLHELTHTQILQHGPLFWTALEKVLPDAKGRRKQMHSYQPTLMA